MHAYQKFQTAFVQFKSTCIRDPLHAAVRESKFAPLTESGKGEDQTETERQREREERREGRKNSKPIPAADTYGDLLEKATHQLGGAVGIRDLSQVVANVRGFEIREGSLHILCPTRCNGTVCFLRKPIR